MTKTNKRTFAPQVIHLNDETDILNWLTDNKSKINHESISAIEYMLYEEVDEKVVVITLNDEFEQRMNLTIDPDEIDITLDTIMEWALKEEEYELCERIKYLKDGDDN